MGIWVDWILEFKGDEEDLAHRLQRVRNRVLEMRLEYVGEFRRVDPVVSSLTELFVHAARISVPDAVKPRIELLQQANEEDMAEFDILPLPGTALYPYTKEWFQPVLEFCRTTNLWKQEDLPLAIRHGLSADGSAESHMEPTNDPTPPGFLGISIGREMISQMYADLLLRYGYALLINPGAGCESVSLVLSGYRNEGGPTHFLGRGSCKTQYSKRLERDHKAVIGILDILEGEGLLAWAEDTSRYWEERDWNKSRSRILEELAVAQYMRALVGGGRAGEEGSEEEDGDEYFRDEGDEYFRDEGDEYFRDEGDDDDGGEQDDEGEAEDDGETGSNPGRGTGGSREG